MEQTLIDNAQRVISNNKFASKLQFKRCQALDMMTAIKNRIKVLTGHWLPFTYKEYKDKIETIFNYEDYGSDIFDTYGQLAKLYYDLGKCRYKIERVFEKDTVLYPQLAACYYSKNRLDPIWCYRKSQIIRKRYRDYLTSSKIHENFEPIHLVLTVPHKGGTWQGKRFYVKELISAFNLMRKSPLWKTYFHAGEYGVEVKKSKNENDGLHIHIHVLLFQRTNFSRKECSDHIEQLWRKYTGNTSNYSGIHYETLFYHQREGKAIHKKYIKPGDSIELYVKGILECIKYHFKTDAFGDFGNWDTDLMAEVLTKTKHVRLYSKFGAFYGVEALNFNRLEETEDQTNEEKEEEVMASLDNDFAINPFTGELAAPSEYKIGITAIDAFKYMHKSNGHKPFAPDKNKYYWLKEGCSIKDCMKAMVGVIPMAEVMEFEDYQRFCFDCKENYLKEKAEEFYVDFMEAQQLGLF
jgi:hypothetical protein